MPNHPIEVHDLVVAADHGQVYIYSAIEDPDPHDDWSGEFYLDALDDAVSSGRFVGVAGNLIDLMTPGQWNWALPMRVEVWPDQPPAEAGWDHEVDVDLDVEDGPLVFEASGGGGQRTEVHVPPSRYRVRVSGRGYRMVGAGGAEGEDSYRLRLWPRATDAPPELRTCWPGWRDYR